VSSLEVLATGPLTTVQDRGRAGLGWLGVSTSGAADRPALDLANRLVGNGFGAAGLEVTLGGLALRASGPATLAVTGARGPVLVDGREVGTHTAVQLLAGAVLRLGVPGSGLRTYLAVRGGIATDPVLGSRSCDLLGGFGLALAVGDVLPVGAEVDGPVPAVEGAPVAALQPGEVLLDALPGPRADWLDDLDALRHSVFEVSARSNRVGVRLVGPVLARRADLVGVELASEGCVPGAVQVPPDGQPVLFLADHPVTGGYPVAAVLTTSGLAAAAQLRPGQRVRLRLLRAPSLG
jgi:biotin-dependent carboxylase-like uncharacterized protein